MATHDYNIANQTGANFRADLNNALSAILSNNASATEPTTTTAYMLWVDTGNNLLKMRNSSDDGWVTLPVSITTSNTVDIDGGTVNTITSLSFSSGETVTTILDEDDLSSDSASALATQQSIKAYVDSQVTAQDLDFQGDTGGALSIDLDSETFTISGGNGIDTSGALNTLTIAIDSSVVTLTDTQTLTNKTIDADSNTISNLEVDNLKSGVLDTDLSDVSASDDTIASAKAIKTYVDSQVTAQDLDFQADSGGALSIDLDSETFTINGGTGIDTVGSENTVQINIDSTVATLSDTQTLTNKTIDADNNTVSNLEVDNLKSGVLDTDLTSVSSSDDTLASAKAIKTYVDAQVTAQDLDLTDGTTSISIDLDSEELSVLGGTGVTSTASGNGVTLAIGQDVGTTADVTFNTVSADLTGDVTGDVTGTVSSIANHSTSDLSEGTNLYYTQARFDTAFAAKDTGDLTEGTNLYYTDERVDDRVSNLLVAGSNVTLTYNDVANTLTIAATEDNLSNNTTDDLAEGSTNLYYTDERVDDRVANLIQDGTGITWSYVDASGTLTPTISLSPFSTSDLSEGTNLYYTTARFDSAFSGKSTTDLTEGTNLYYTTARFDSAFSGKSTSDLTEGTNLYYTDSRFDTRLATKTTSDLTEGSNLYFTTARIDSHLSGGTGVTYSSGTISIGQAVGTTDNVTFGDVIVSGDLTVSGTTTTVNTETVTIADNIIVLNSNATGTPSENSGIEIERGDATNKTLIWDETNDKWTVGSETFVAATFEGNVTGNVTGQVSDISNHDTDDLAEGASNLYYTTARFDSAFSGKTTSDLTEGTNLYYTTARANSDFDTRLATKSTTDLAEGTNLYYTTARFDTAFSGKDTDDLTEGATNLYYTDARVDSHLSGGTGVTYSSGVISIGQSVGTGDSVTFAGVTSDFTGDIEGAVKFTAKADVALTKGQVVYISGISGDVPTVNLADADNASAMPAFGLVYANANQNAEVEIITFGSLSGFDTSSFTVGKTVYVSTTAGSLTTTAPTGESSLIQNIGMVQRSHATAGIIKVGGAGRTNATPNLNSGKIFYGNGSNQSTPTTLDTSIVPENTNLYYTDARFDTRFSSKDTDDLTEGATNLYYTTARFDTAFSGKDTDYLSEGVSNLYFTDERVDDRVSNLLVGGTGITVTYNDVANTLTIDGSAQYGDSDVESYLDSGTSTPTFASAIISGDLTVDTSTLAVDSTNNRVGILDATPAVTLDVGTATDAIFVPKGTTAQRPTGVDGYFRYNTDDAQFEGYVNGSWGAIGGAGGNYSALSTDIFSGDGSTVDFTLSQNITDENNLVVFIDGVFQAHNTFTVSGTTLTFSTAPVSGRVITAYGVKNNLAATISQTLTVIGRSANVNVGITSGNLNVEARSGTISVGV